MHGPTRIFWAERTPSSLQGGSEWNGELDCADPAVAERLGGVRLGLYPIATLQYR